MTLGEIRERFGAELEARLRAALAGGLCRTMVDYHLGTGGKRVRALLPLWICERLGGDARAHLDLAVGMELLHNATLVHDDVQDGDEWRRGKATVVRLWGAPQAINAGDALYFEALHRLSRAPLAARALPVAIGAMIRTIEGQAMEFQLQLPRGVDDRLEPTLDTWIAMATRKTGALYGACFQIGALAGEAPPDRVAALAAFGEGVGLLFQVQDDYLDLVGDKGRGRQGTDLEEGKLSFPVVWALTHAGRSSARAILNVVRTPRAKTTSEMVASALAELGASGALEATSAWLRAARDRLGAHPEAALVPGLLEQVLAPVADHL